jgi:multidrug efflux system membrane fusion protein
MQILSRSTILALIIVVAVAGWVLSGLSSRSRQAGDIIAESTRSSRTAVPSDDASEPASSERSLLRVSVVESRATDIVREIIVSARTEPNRTVELRSEVEGRIVELNAERGAVVAEGDQIARLDIRDREERLAEAEALIAQHELQFQAAERLGDQGLLSEVQIAEARARLVSSRAALANIELEIEHTRIFAPFDAVVQDRDVEVGDFVKVGDTVAELVDTDPLVVVGEVNEQDIRSLQVGKSGLAELVDGQTVDGTVRYVAPVAQAGTRTFRVELAVANPDNRYRAGMTAELRVASENASGHLLSPALLTLDDAGTIGIKSVDSSNRVQFNPVEVLRSSDEGVWVAGLPETVRIITVGQGFVSAGERVEPVMMPVGRP